MSLRYWGENQSWRMRFAIVILAAGAVLFPARAFADGAGTCTAGTTVRLSAPEASQGSLLLIALKSTKSLAEVQGDWGGRSVPMWRAGAEEGQRKGLLGVDLEKEPGEYGLEITGEKARGEEVSCSVKVAVREGRFANERVKVGTDFVEPILDIVKREKVIRMILNDIIDRV